jgi:hypothetical protein
LRRLLKKKLVISESNNRRVPPSESNSGIQSAGASILRSNGAREFPEPE